MCTVVTVVIVLYRNASWPYDATHVDEETLDAYHEKICRNLGIVLREANIRHHKHQDVFYINGTLARKKNSGYDLETTVQVTIVDEAALLTIQTEQHGHRNADTMQFKFPFEYVSLKYIPTDKLYCEIQQKNDVWETTYHRISS